MAKATIAAALLLLGLTYCVPRAMAEPDVGHRNGEASDSFSPGADASVPVPSDTYDWIQLTSDEWLKGEIIAMFGDKLEFDSEELKILNLDWDDIKQIRSGQIIQVRGRNGITATGLLRMDGERIRVLGGQEQQFDRSQILRFTAGKSKELDYWTGKISLGANFRRGSSDSLEGSGQVDLRRRTIYSRLVLNYLGNYDETEHRVTANNHRATAVWDKFINDRLFVVPVFGEYYRDPILNVEHRATVGLGLGYQLMDTAKTELHAFSGPAFQETRFSEVEAGRDDSESTLAMLVGTRYDSKVSRSVDFNFTYRLQVVSEDAGTFNHHMLAEFEIEMSDMLDLDLSMVWDYTDAPQPESNGDIPNNDDVRLILALALRL